MDAGVGKLDDIEGKDEVLFTPAKMVRMSYRGCVGEDLPHILNNRSALVQGVLDWNATRIICLKTIGAVTSTR